MIFSRTQDSVRLRAKYVFTVWTVLGIFNCFEMWLSYLYDGSAITWWQVVSSTMPRTWVWALLTPLIFEVSARFPARPRMPALSVLAHIATWLGCLTLHALANTVNRFGISARQQSFATYFEHGFLLWIPSTLVLYCATAGVAQWLLSMQRVRQHERARALMSGQLAKAELTALRMQLHPHFLFNTLNTIAILIRERDTGIAERLVTQLGDVLRQVLHRSEANETTLGEELAFLRTYLEIEQVRFGDRLVVNWRVDEDLLHATVPVLLLQPLVENALRHGIAHAVDGGFVEIGARRTSGDIEVWVTDNGCGLDRRRDDHANGSEQRSGVGLMNTRQRLEQLYPRRARLTLQREPNGDTRAHVTMPLNLWAGPPVDADASRMEYSSSRLQ